MSTTDRYAALTAALQSSEPDDDRFIAVMQAAYDAIWDAAHPDDIALLAWFRDETGFGTAIPMPLWFEEGNPEFYADLLTTLAHARS